MQNTLLGLAIAIILVLTAALAAPFFVDWNQYRALLETQATRVVGAPVRIVGSIEARLLPTPSLRLNDIELGRGSDKNQVRARALGFEFALGPLLRGEFRVSDMHLVAPDFRVGLDSSGRVEGPPFAIGFNADALSIDNLTIEDGRAEIEDVASGTQIVLDELSFNGRVRSLAGSFKGEGMFVSGDERAGYELTASPATESGGLKLKLGLHPLDRPLTLDAEGTLAWQDRAPRFDGTVVLTRPAGLVLASGQTQLSEPWRTTSRVTATPSSALFEQVEFQYGPEEHNVKLTGTAEMKFGTRLSFEALLSARQIDLDHMLPDAAGQPPMAVLRTLAATLGGGSRPPMPMRLGIGIEAVTLGGAKVQSLRGDLRGEGDSWSLDTLEFRAPGFAQVQVSGRLDLGGDGVAFAGPVAIEAGDPRALAAWLERRNETATSQFSPLQAQATVTLGRDRLELADFKAGFDRQSIEGRVSYAFAGGDHPARLEANVRAAELDLDAGWAFAKSAFGATSLERPGEVALAVLIDRTTLAGVAARQVEARLRLDGNALQVDRLAAGDLSGAAVALSGRIDSLMTAPRGKLSFDLDAHDLSGITALLAKFAPEAAEPVRRAGSRLLPAKLHTVLSLEDAVGGITQAKLDFNGQAGHLRFNIAAQASGTLATLPASDVQLDGKIDADDGGKLADALDLRRYLAIDQGPAHLIVGVKGALGGDLHLDGRVTAAGLDVGTGGTLRLLGDQPAGTLAVTVGAADLRPLRQVTSGQAPDPLPVSFVGKLTLDGKTLALGDIAGKVAGSAVRGGVAVTAGDPVRIDGAFDAEAVDASALLAAAIGLPASGGGRPELGLWSAEPFAARAADVTGEIRLKAARAMLTPDLMVRQAQASVRLSRSEIAVEEFSGALAGGRLAAQMTVRTGESGVSTHTHIGLTDAEAAALVAGPRPPIGGRVGLQLDLDGDGLSPAALLGSVSGGGTLSLDGAQLDALSPKVFDTLTRAVDRGMVLDTARIQDVTAAALASGAFAVPRIEAAVAVAAGQARLGTTIAHGQNADLSLSGSFDIGQAAVDLRLTLSGPAGATASGLRPDVLVTLKGPVGAVKRTIDVSALAGWLTLRAVEQQAQRLEAAEASRRASADPGQALSGAKPDAEGAKEATGSTAPAATAPQGVGIVRPPPLPSPIEIRPAPAPVERKPVHPPVRITRPTGSIRSRLAPPSDPAPIESPFFSRPDGNP